jgi:chemotaxis protein CheC
MQLTAYQQDALTELINIGFGRAAASLSKLTGHRVILEVPKIGTYEIGEVADILGPVLGGDIASVHQIFSGPVSGDALLILDYPAAVMLKELLTDEPALPLPFDASAREALTEVGNILLNACLGTFGNLLKVQVSFSVPRLTLESLRGVLESLAVDHEELRYAIVIHAAFRLRDSAVTGYLVMVLGVASLDRLLRTLDSWNKAEY